MTYAVTLGSNFAKIIQNGNANMPVIITGDTTITLFENTINEGNSCLKIVDGKGGGIRVHIGDTVTINAVNKPTTTMNELSIIGEEILAVLNS